LIAGEETGRAESGEEETGGDFEFWDESKTTQGRLLFIGAIISAQLLTKTAADSIGIWTETILV
jgi:hypothetical protein